VTIIFLAHDCNIPFIANELRFMLASDNVKKIIIYTDYPIVDDEIAFHDKCTVYIFGKMYTPLLDIPFKTMALKELIGHFGWYLKRNKWNEVLVTLRDHLKKASQIKENGIPEDAKLYSYWAGSGAFIISCLKKQGIKNLSLCRLHAFDIYEECDNHGHIPWRSFVLKQLDLLIPISEHGRQYLLNKYPFTLPKTRTITLGIPLLEEPLNKAPDAGKQIVSCSWVGTRKNLTGVFDALQSMSDTTWIHLGDGWYFETLKNHVNKPSLLQVQLPGRFSQDEIRTFYREKEITCFISLSTNEGLPVSMMEAMAFGIPVVSTDVGGCAEIVTPETGVLLPGRISQDDIRSFYREKEITCFISLSTNEGLPVSMMEAMAFGIPVVSTDVGGCAEIVTPETGVLLPKNYTHEDVIKAVNICAQKFAAPEARKRIQDFIRQHFDAEKNYNKFLEFLDVENQKHLQKYTK